MSRSDRRRRLEAGAEHSRAIVTSNLVLLRELDERDRRTQALADAGATQIMNRQWLAEAMASASTNYRRSP